jgi:hypothetical protein
MRQKIYLILVLWLITISAFAQPTITANDYRKLIGVSEIIGNYASFEAAGLSALVAAQGPNQIWDITGKAYFKIDSSEFIYFNYPGGAPRANDPAFTGCNLVARFKNLWIETSITNWQFLSLNDTGFLAYGTVIDSAGYNQVASKNTPPILSYKFPMTYNTSWKATTTINNAGGFVTKATYTNLVDGYGTLKTPAGTFSCLRLRQKIDAETGGPFPAATTSFTYYFLGKDTPYGIAAITADANNLPYMVNYVDVKLVTAIDRFEEVTPRNFELAQNYPNPFNAVTTIEFYLPQSSHVMLKVFNLTGEEVATLTAENLSAGRHVTQWNAGGLASGVYFYQLQAGNFVEMKKLILIK